MPKRNNASDLGGWKVWREALWVAGYDVDLNQKEPHGLIMKALEAVGEHVKKASELARRRRGDVPRRASRDTTLSKLRPRTATTRR